MKSTYDVFVDEAGQSPYFNDNQPVVVLTGVITNRQNIDFDIKVAKLLKNFGLSEDTPIHAQPLIGGNEPFNNINKFDREEILYKFIELGMQFIEYYHQGNKLKPFERTKSRELIQSRNLDPYLNLLHYFITSLDFYFDKAINSDYSLFFDSSDDFNIKTKRMIKELSKESENHYQLKRLIGEPQQTKSKENRFIQLSDALCYITVRYTQLYVKTYTGSNKYEKYRSYIYSCHNLFKEKELPFIRWISKFEQFTEGVFSDKKDLILFSDWRNRDFSHLGKFPSKRRKQDNFDPNVHTLWMKDNQKIKGLNDRMVEIFKLNMPRISIYILKLAKIMIESKINEGQYVEEDNPETQRYLDIVNDQIKKIQESDALIEKGQPGVYNFLIVIKEIWEILSGTLKDLDLETSKFFGKIIANIKLAEKRNIEKPNYYIVHVLQSQIKPTNEYIELISQKQPEIDSYIKLFKEIFGELKIPDILSKIKESDECSQIIDEVRASIGKNLKAFNNLKKSLSAWRSIGLNVELNKIDNYISLFFNFKEYLDNYI